MRCNRFQVVLAIAVVAVLALATSANAAPVASFDFHGHANGPVETDEPTSNVDGLQLPGWVGPWGTLPAANTSATQRQGSVGGYTFTFNVGGAEMISAWVAGGPDDLRRDYYYINNPARYSGPVPWRIENLTPGTAYDIILFGRGDQSSTGPAQIYIPGHDAGNGVGAPVTLDSEGDANFLSVFADGSGYINGFYDTALNTSANITGVQFAEAAGGPPPPPPPPPLEDITRPGDPIALVNGVNDGDGNSGPPPGAEGVENAINDIGQKYLNFLDLGSGFAVTPSENPFDVGVAGLRLYTANDGEPRDPASFVLEGSNGDLASGPWTLIESGQLALPSGRNAGGSSVSIPPTGNFDANMQEILFDQVSAHFEHYRVTFPTLKDAAAANSMQIGEVELLGDTTIIPEPASFALAALGLVGLMGISLLRRRR